MSISWWNSVEITARGQNRQQKEDVPHRDTEVENGRQPSVILDILNKGMYNLYANLVP
jgi:hypothetical protein